MALKMIVTEFIFASGLCFSVCVGFGRKELASRAVSLDVNCYTELNTVLKRENEALVKLQKCTEDSCELSKNGKREHCTKNGYTFNSELDMCYKLYPTPTVCKDAIKICADDGGRMATLDSTQKVSFFTEYMKRHHASVEGLLAGGHYDQRDGVWRWEDGSKIGQLNWGSGQPSTKNECLGMYRGDSYKWHDFTTNGHKGGFLCELR